MDLTTEPTTTERSGARRGAALVAALAVLAGIAVFLLPGSASAAVVLPKPLVKLPTGLEPVAPYVGQADCDPSDKPGATALGKLLVATYPGTTYGISRACKVGQTSEHYDGRAVDWMNNVRVASEAARATALINWLLAKDASGQPYAMARRLGVMYIIWNNRQWGVWSPTTWTAYSNCASHPEASYDSTCHRNHIHFSLTWAGAMRRTSFWTGAVGSTDYGPCRPSYLTYASRYTSPNPNRCSSYPALKVPTGASTTLKNLITWSGAYAHYGSSGAMVSAVQAALWLPQSAWYDYATMTAVKRYQANHAMSQSGWMDAPTWRSMMSHYGMKF